MSTELTTYTKTATVAEGGEEVKPKMMTKKRTTISDLLRPLTSIRYLIIRTISVPVPFWSNRIPLIGGRTFIELVIMALIAYLAISGAGSGSNSDKMSALIILLAMRFNVLTAVLGIPFERALFWHKLVALVAMGCIGVHMKSKGNNNTGVALIILMSIACGSYLIKPYFFNLFHITHVLCYVMTIPYALKHGCNYFPYAIIFWGFDLLMRYVITQRYITMQSEVITGDVVKLSFEKRFEYEPGQYCFILIPTINYVEYHPFSISSCAEEATTTLHIRALGDWSKRLLTKTKKLQEENGGKPVPMTVFCEGPFGAPSINHESSEYTVWLLISGGIGITPLQSMYNHFINQAESGERRFRKVIFVWSVKDKVTAEIIEADRAKASYLPLSFQPPMNCAPAVLADNVRKVSPHNSQTSGSRSGDVAVHDADAAGATTETAADETINAIQNSDDIEQQNRRARDSANEDGIELETPLVFHAEYYLTQVRSEEEFATAGIDPVEQKHLHFGRPDIPKLFDRTRKLCSSEGIHRVGVMVCGPQGMVNEVMDLCQKSQLEASCSAVRFDGHSEVFNF